MIRLGMAGAGFACAVVARALAESGRATIDVFETRPHVAGNCHTERDETTGIMLHRYGPHIFNTSREDVWSYVQRWAKFYPFTNRVKAITARGVFSLPVNLLTINQFFGKTFSPQEARSFIASLGDRSIAEPQNFEEQALKMMGRQLYENFFRDYTRKQWGVDPTLLPASILKRLPMRFSYDDNYYEQKYQGLPEEGYTTIVERILDHSAIRTHLNQPFPQGEKYDHVFWSGPLDAYFAHRLGRLSYRTLHFERDDGEGDLQGNPVLNYCHSEVAFTRVAEHKHFSPWESHPRSVMFREFSASCGSDDTPYYPLRLVSDKDRLAQYVKLADQAEGVTFLGRLGTYRYLDMHVVIGESLDLAATCMTTPLEAWPRFSVRPL